MPLVGDPPRTLENQDSWEEVVVITLSGGGETERGKIKQPTETKFSATLAVSHVDFVSLATLNSSHDFRHTQK